MTQYTLVFECCGNEIRLGQTPEVGQHDDHCLSCDTANPETEVESR